MTCSAYQMLAEEAARLGLVPEDFAKALGIGPWVVGAWADGRRAIPRVVWELVAEKQEEAR